MTVLQDPKAARVYRAIARKVRPYTEADIAMASGLSKQVVRKRCQALEKAGLIRESWVNVHGPFWDLTPASGA